MKCGRTVHAERAVDQILADSFQLDVRAALETMKARRVRSLLVVEQGGRLVGIVSIHDIAGQSRSRSGEVSPDAVLDAFIAITAPAHAPVTA
jgi:CBS domain-containing protein